MNMIIIDNNDNNNAFTYWSVIQLLLLIAIIYISLKIIRHVKLWKWFVLTLNQNHSSGLFNRKKKHLLYTQKETFYRCRWSKHMVSTLKISTYTHKVFFPDSAGLGFHSLVFPKWFQSLTEELSKQSMLSVEAHLAKA